ncbi:VOC family protein [Mycolicibacterium stellerae]|uniref:VOC family protein n=1 Tax=Mycolicibacterium stellerae TaxID=2358193 RepID=UPI000F0B1623|nr:VOC family protein [Mycolicibacterium stellerae]
MSINRIDHATLKVDDLSGSLEWYVQGLGLKVLDKSSDTAHLGVGDDHTALTLVEGGKGLVSFALGVDSDDDLDTYAARLHDAGNTTDRRHDVSRIGAGQILRTELPSGHCIELQTGSGGRTAGLPNAASWDHSSRTSLGLDHINLVSDDTKSLLSFLTTTLDFRTSQVMLASGDEDGWSIFWARTSSDYHHDIACVEAPNTRGGLHHLAFLVDGIEHMKLICDSLAEVQRVVEYGPGRHPEVNLFLYAFDPSGNRIEFAAEMPKIPADQGTEWSSPELLMNSWSPWVPDTFFTKWS